jgi:hypothetical protein
MYQKILSGVPQVLKSKFKFTYGLLLNLISVGNMSFCEFIEKSMLNQQIQSQISGIKHKISSLEGQVKREHKVSENMEIDFNIVEQYINMKNEYDTANQNKKKQKIKHNIFSFEKAYPKIQDHTKQIQKVKMLEQDVISSEKNMDSTIKQVENNVTTILSILNQRNFITPLDDSKYTLSEKGNIASHIHEIHCLLIGDLYSEGYFDNLTTPELIGFFSCFSNLKVSDDYKDINCPEEYNNICSIVNRSNDLLNEYEQISIDNNLYKPSDNSEMQYDFVKYSYIWADQVNNEKTAKKIIDEAKFEKNIFLGEFIKALLKINNIAAEFENVCEITNNMKLLKKIKEIPDMTMKYIATNQSLYV